MNHIRNILLVAAALALTACASAPLKPPKVERISAEELEKIMPKPAPNLTLDDIVKLSNQGVTADQIIEQIKNSHSSYELTPTESISLNAKGVDAKVLDFIHTQREQALRDSFSDEINKREAANSQEKNRLQRSLQQQPPIFYDPFYNPYWGWGYRPFIRGTSRFRY